MGLSTALELGWRGRKPVLVDQTNGVVDLLVIEMMGERNLGDFFTILFAPT